MLQSKTDNPLDGLHLETYVRADADGVASCAAGLLAARCAEAVSRRGVFTLALSGGSTPLTLFRLLRTEAWAARVDWAHTRVFWVDERCVAPDHPASNYGAANQELLAHVPAAEIYPMDGEIDPGESAVAYEELLRQHVPAEQGMPRLDCALLGMGDDGHTASLFPGSPLLAPEALRSGRLPGFAVAEHLAPKPESRRITLTLEMINAARCCLYLATGEGASISGASAVSCAVSEPRRRPATSRATRPSSCRRIPSRRSSLRRRSSSVLKNSRFGMKQSSPQGTRLLRRRCCAVVTLRNGFRGPSVRGGF